MSGFFNLLQQTIENSPSSPEQQIIAPGALGGEVLTPLTAEQSGYKSEEQDQSMKPTMPTATKTTAQPFLQGLSNAGMQLAANNVNPVPVQPYTLPIYNPRQDQQNALSNNINAALTARFGRGL